MTEVSNLLYGALHPSDAPSGKISYLKSVIDVPMCV